VKANLLRLKLEAMVGAAGNSNKIFGTIKELILYICAPFYRGKW
jgi:hypothetical protein